MARIALAAYPSIFSPKIRHTSMKDHSKNIFKRYEASEQYCMKSTKITSVNDISRFVIKVSCHLSWAHFTFMTIMFYLQALKGRADFFPIYQKFDTTTAFFMVKLCKRMNTDRIVKL